MNEAKLRYYSRFKEVTEFQLHTLRNQLAQSVPSGQLCTARIDLEKMAAKYRSLLDSLTTAKSPQPQTITHVDSKELEALQETLALEKEKRMVLEAMQTIEGVSAGAVTQIQLLSKRMATLELKELNERERANHAARQWEIAKEQLRNEEQRSSELERKVSQLSKACLEMQELETEARHQFLNSVSREESEADKKRVRELEGSEMALRHEVEKLKDIALIADRQRQAIEQEQKNNQLEVQSLRDRVLELESNKGPDESSFGRLNRQLTQLQLADAEAVKRASEHHNSINRLETSNIKLERRITDKDNQLNALREEHKSKENRLRKTVHQLRLRYAGCVAVSESEKMSRLLREAQADRERMFESLQTAEAARSKAEGLAAREVSFQTTAAELAALLKDEENPDRIAIVVQKLQQLQTRLADTKMSEAMHRRAAERLQKTAHYLESVSRSQEVQITALDNERLRLEKELEEAQLIWEQREAQLEDALHAALKNEVAVAQQLEINALRRRVVDLVDYAKVEHVVDSSADAVKVLEERLANKEQVLAKTKQLLEEACRETELMKQRHAEQIRHLNEQMLGTADRSMKQLLAAVTNEPDEESQAKRKIYQMEKSLRNLEEALNEQQQMLSVQAAKLRLTEDENSRTKQSLEDAKTKSDKEISRLIHSHETSFYDGNFREDKKILGQEIRNQMEKVALLQDELQSTQNELENWKYKAAKAPSIANKKLTDRLKNEVAAKERQNQALTKALEELRGELMKQVSLLGRTNWR
ncbi:hypothetical protein Ciccas_006683 [Cichlidogyrus casuarinus]|uniref:Centrosomal protein of 290kDa coiled-coil region domain-containing protein n=1 Tax=Cichlidogyrus casuarinus TaxID=1844966 RepID=A0ABD2Q541_9PLAT